MFTCQETTKRITVISIQDITEYMLKTYPGVKVSRNWGEKGLFYNPNNALPKGIYVLTFKEKDGPHDKASSLDRTNHYRLNLGISKESFRSMFGAVPARPAAGEVVASGHDFKQIDTIMPHPVYGWMAWIAVINPSAATFAKLQPLIDESVTMAKLKFAKRRG